MIEKVRDTLSKYAMVQPGDAVVLAVSGGPDSMALLHIMYRLMGELAISLQVVHVNHMFRGEEALQEAQMVENFAQKLGIPFEVFHEDVPYQVKKTKGSKQAVARTIRYGCLEQVAAKIGAQRIATGHHADDQAETVLLHLLRGSGGSGLQGILPVRQERYIRPLIGITRQEIENYCQEEGLPFAIDPSNSTNVYLRNQVRHQVIPLLKTINPEIVRALTRVADILQADEQFLEEQTNNLFTKIIKPEEEKVFEVLVEDLLAVELAMQRRLVRRLLTEVRGENVDIDFNQVERVLALAKAQSGEKVLQLGRGLKARKSYNRLIFGNTEEGLVKEYFYEIPVPGQVVVSEAGTVITTAILEKASEESFDKVSSEGSNGSKTYLLDLDKTGRVLVVRNRRPGDRFVPKGAPGGKKLKDFLIDHKVERQQRDCLPILVKDDQVVAVGTMRASANFGVDSTTTRMLAVTLTPLSAEK